MRFSGLRGERVLLGTGATVINDCYNANPLSMRAALDDLATHETAGRRLAVLGDMLELGPAEDEHHRDVGAYAATAGVDVLVTVGPRAAKMLDAFDGEGYAVGDARRGGRAGGRADRRRATCCWSRARAGSGLEVVAEALARGGGRRLMGEVLIAGTASLLICIFLSPKFISFLRRREFGQQIREEGPQEHHAKAGTPTMGGIIIFTAIAVPFLLLTDSRRARGRRVRRRASRARCSASPTTTSKVAQRRSLGLRGRTKLVVTILIAVGLWLVATEWAGLPDTINLRIIDAQVDVGILYPVFIYFVVAGTTLGREPDRRARRAGRGLRGDRAARLHRDHVHDAPDRPRAGRRAASSARASASSGSTRSRRRSSWATRGRSAWAAGSRRWR